VNVKPVDQVKLEFNADYASKLIKEVATAPENISEKDLVIYKTIEV